MSNLPGSPSTSRRAASRKKILKFPKEFLWACASSSFQTEGAWREGGKSISSWDVLCSVPGRIKGGTDARIAIDRYHRYPADCRLMKQFGVKAYRLSTSWPRVVPQGTGKINPRGLDFYDRYIDCMLSNGIRPFVNLYHWDMPLVQEKRGGWRKKATARAFADYAAAVVDRFSDRVTDWMTFNEIKHMWEGCFQGGWNAPGLFCDEKTNNQVLHNVHIGHGLAVQAIRARSKSPNPQIGLIHAFWARMPHNPDDPRDLKAAEKCFQDKSGRLFDPIYKGIYPANTWSRGAEPEISAGEMDIVSQPLDFFGLNCYGGCTVSHADNGAGWEEHLYDPSLPVTPMNWTVTPTAMYWGIKHVWDNYDVKKVYVTENGCASMDTLTHDNKVHDPDRIRFLYDYIEQMHKAISEGYKVDGYFHWTFCDNFEWTAGYTQRIGLVYVDYPTQRRIPKDSATFYKNVINRNALDPAWRPI